MRWCAFILSILLGSAITPLRAQVDQGGRITGRVTGADTQAGLAGVRVGLYLSTAAHQPLPWRSTYTDAIGNYSFTGLASSNYWVGFKPEEQSGYVWEFYAGAGTLASATAITVTAGQTSQVNASLAVGGRIRGTLTTVDGGSELQSFGVAAYDSTGAWITTVNVGASGGSYEVIGLRSGSYRLWFGPATGDPALYLGEYYDNAASLEQATPIDVVAGQITGGINALMGKGKNGSAVYLPLLMR
jgi:hypothetical protein